MDKLFNKLLNELNKLHIDKTEIVVFGSTVWEYFGIREARDIDIIISNKIKKSTVGSKKNIASKEIMINEVVGVGINKFVNIGFEDKDFFVNGDLTFEINGIKLVKPEIEFSRLIHREGFKRDFDVKRVMESLIKESSYPWDWNLVVNTPRNDSISGFNLFILRLGLIFQNPSKLYTGFIKRIKKLKTKTPKLSHDFQDIGLFLLNQYKGNIFNRYDILIRHKLIQSNFENSEYIDAYKLMQKKRMNLSEDDANKKLEIFKNLHKSFLNYYREDQSPIEINQDYKLIDGSHRVAIHLTQGSSNIPIKYINEKTPEFPKEWFINHSFNSELLSDLDKDLDNLLIEKGTTFNCVIWQGGNNYIEKIMELINKQHTIKLFVSNVVINNFDKFLFDIYKIDNLEEWKIHYKLNELNKINSKTVSLISFLVLNPDWRIRENSESLISKKIELLKANLRTSVSESIDSHIDTILHIGDNTKQNRHIYETFISYGLIRNDI